MEVRHLRLDFHDIQPSTRRIVEFSKTHPITAVGALDDGGALLAATAAAALAIPHNAVDAVEAAPDKARIRERMLAARRPTPPFPTAGLGEDPRGHPAAPRESPTIKT